MSGTEGGIHVGGMSYLSTGRSRTVWYCPCRERGVPCSCRGAWVLAWASSRDKSRVDTNDLGLLRDWRPVGRGKTTMTRGQRSSS